MAKHNREKRHDMEPDKKDSPDKEGEESKQEQQAPADALSRTPDDLEEEKAAQEAANPKPESPDQPETKKLSPLKTFFRKVNVYFLVFLILVAVAGVYMIVSYLNSQKPPEEPNIATQKLTQDALKQLANTDVTVGGAAQTFSIQGNAIIAGQTLMRGNLNVAGSLQTGGSITAPNITISGTSNLGTAQINSLQVAQNTAIQGSTTMRDLSVSGTSTFSGAMTASQISVTQLTLSGNAVLQVPNHVSFTGPTPSRASVNAAVLGAGGTASISGSDTSGTINISTGASPTSGCFASFNFAKAFTGTPRVNVTPVGAAAGQTQFYVTRTTTSFSICTANAAPANQQFSYDFFIAG